MENDSHATTSAERVIDWARSGVVALTGHPGDAPLVPPGHAATHARRLGERIAEMTSGTRHPVRLDGAAVLAERAAFFRGRRAGRVSVGGRCRLLRTADGWAAVSCARPDDPALLGAVVGKALADDPWGEIAAWLRRHPGTVLEERAELLGVAAAAVPVRAAGAPVPRPGAPRSVEGMLVVDFSALWAGPLCAHVLGLAGANVVKVETPDRPDGARAGAPGFYDLLHAGHRSVVVDPATAGGRRALAGLVRAADIVIESSRPRALAGFGLDAAAAVADGKTWVSITAAGRASNRVGFGDDVAAGAGLVAWDGQGAPVFCGDAIADPLAGLTAVALVLTGTPGGGALWDVAMRDVVAATLRDWEAGPLPAARREGATWVVDTEDGPVPVAPPRRRTPSGVAARGGADTAVVLGALAAAGS